MKHVFLYLKVIFTLFIFTLTACSSAGTVYKTFTLREGVGHFSFEYPEGYEVSQQEIIPGEPQNTMVSLRSPSESKPDPTISVAVMERNPFAEDAEGAMQFQMEILKQRPEFKLLEQSSVKVADVKGQGVCFSYRSGAAGDTDSFTVFTRAAYFDAGGLVWLIYVNPQVKDGKIDKTVFDHMLKTFKILD